MEENEKVMEEMFKAFDEVQMPRTPYALKKLVVDTKFTDEQKYHQCVIELENAYSNLRIAKAKARIAEIEIESMPQETETQRLEREIKMVELERLNRARLGTMREFETLFAIWQNFPVKYTREQINAAQQTEYRLRLETQAQFDVLATGRVSQGNNEALRQIGRIPTLQLDSDGEVFVPQLGDGTKS